MTSGLLVEWYTVNQMGIFIRATSNTTNLFCSQLLGKFVLFLQDPGLWLEIGTVLQIAFQFLTSFTILGSVMSKKLLGKGGESDPKPLASVRHVKISVTCRQSSRHS
jgi:hypothetical protein